MKEDRQRKIFVRQCSLTKDVTRIFWRVRQKMSRANLVPSAKDVAYLRWQDFPSSERSRTSLPVLLRKNKRGRRSTLHQSEYIQVGLCWKS